VNETVRSTAPDMETLRRQLAAQEQRILDSAITGTGYRQFLDALAAKSPKTAPPKPAKSGETPESSRAEDDLTEAIQAVYAIAAELDTVYTPVTELLDRVAAAPHVSTCLEQARTNIKREPLTVTPETRDGLKPGDSVGLAITGGEGGYTAQPVGTAAQALRIGAVEGGAHGVGHVVVTVAARATTNTYTVEIRDGAKGRVPVYLGVTAAEATRLRVSGDAERTVKAGKGQTASFRLEGGKPPYVARVTGDAAEVAVATADGAIVATATLTAKAKKGDVISVIVRDQDGAGPPVVLTVKVGD
jgi:hypothetical protein